MEWLSQEVDRLRSRADELSEEKPARDACCFPFLVGGTDPVHDRPHANKDCPNFMGNLQDRFSTR